MVLPRTLNWRQLRRTPITCVKEMKIDARLPDGSWNVDLDKGLGFQLAGGYQYVKHSPSERTRVEMELPTTTPRTTLAIPPILRYE